MTKRKNSKKNKKKGGIKKYNQVDDIRVKENVEERNLENDFEEIVEDESFNEHVLNNKKAISSVKRELIYSSNDSGDEISKLFKIVLIVTGIMIVFYGITVFVTRKVNAIKTAKLGKSSEKVSIQYDNIIIGSMFNIDGHYYVLIEKENDDNISEYDTLLKSIAANDEALKVYIADLGSSFNKKYFDKTSNYDSDLSNFKVADTTLVEVKDHKIEATYDNYDSIKKKLDELQ